jgi:hypothetical protein
MASLWSARSRSGRVAERSNNLFELPLLTPQRSVLPERGTLRVASNDDRQWNERSGTAQVTPGAKMVTISPIPWSGSTAAWGAGQRREGRSLVSQHRNVLCKGFVNLQSDSDFERMLPSETPRHNIRRSRGWRMRRTPNTGPFVTFTMVSRCTIKKANEINLAGDLRRLSALLNSNRTNKRRCKVAYP